MKPAPKRCGVPRIPVQTVDSKKPEKPVYLDELDVLPRTVAKLK